MTNIVYYINHRVLVSVRGLTSIRHCHWQCLTLPLDGEGMARVVQRGGHLASATAPASGDV